MAKAAKTQRAGDPRQLITKDHVTAALRSDKGNETELISFEIEDFTKKGDNLASYVTSINIKYSTGRETGKVAYIVKANPCRSIKGYDGLTKRLFTKEIKFHEDIKPDLQHFMASIGQRPLGFPKCFHSSLETEKELVFFEDLRARGFGMAERQKGMDSEWAVLVMKELALLHSASYLLMKKHPDGDGAHQREFLNDTSRYTDPQMSAIIDNIFKGAIAFPLALLKNISGYEKAKEWMKEQEGSPSSLLFKMLASSPPFNVICHGDLWNNNFLFRQDEEGHPTAIMLLDLQATRIASFATDLNHFLFSNLTGDVRQKNLKNFLDLYYSTFSSVVATGGEQMPFSKEEFLQEFRRKHEYGLLMGIVVAPVALLDSEDSPDADYMFGDKMGEKESEFFKSRVSNIASNPLLKQRFLALLDEMDDAGVFD